MGELCPEAMEVVSGSRRTEMLDWLFFDLSDLRLGEFGRALKTLSHLEGLTLGSADCFTAMSDMCSLGISSERAFAVDLLSMFSLFTPSKLHRQRDGRTYQSSVLPLPWHGRTIPIIFRSPNSWSTSEDDIAVSAHARSRRGMSIVRQKPGKGNVTPKK